jgi:hypothetical protein
MLAERLVDVIKSMEPHRQSTGPSVGRPALKNASGTVAPRTRTSAR